MFKRRPKATIIFTVDGDSIDVNMKFRPKKYKEGQETPPCHSAALIAFHLFNKEIEEFAHGNTE